MACCRDERNANITESKSLKFKISVTGKTHGNKTDVTIAVPVSLIFGELLKCL